ncbi:MAG: glycosyltransferase [Patescibacteria group bacterium]
MPKKYFLIVSRLEPYKKTELAIDAFAIYRKTSEDSNAKKHKLIIVGKGSQEWKLFIKAQTHGLYGLLGACS